MTFGAFLFDPEIAGELFMKRNEPASPQETQAQK
jgi:hypothetical protein